MTAATEVRDGHIWCLRHGTWWKLCPCPGQTSMTIPIDAALIEANTPKQGAYLDVAMANPTGVNRP